MSADEIDAYLTTVAEPARSTLEALRRNILAILPEADQVISYQLPGFRSHGQVLAGFGAFAKHLSYLPHSGSVLPALAGELRGYQHTKSSLHFPFDEPLPSVLVRRLIEVRCEQAGITLSSA